MPVGLPLLPNALSKMLVTIVLSSTSKKCLKLALVFEFRSLSKILSFLMIT